MGFMPNAAQEGPDHGLGPEPALSVIDGEAPGIVTGQARAFGSERMNSEDKMMERAKFAGILLVLAQVGVFGCSSAETPSDGTSGGSGGAGGSGASGGAGGSTGGSATGGTGTGGSSSGTGGGATTDPNCKGISTGAACANMGLHCEPLVCGLGDSGSRTCDCNGTWSCTACNWDNTPYAWAMAKPADITTCTGTEQDGASCPTLDATCEGAPNNEACVCYLDDEDSQIWDCDKPPGTWAM
jgi:hypothetical protein